MADALLDQFWDPDHGGVYTTPEDGEALVARQKDLFDNATPSANSIAALALYRLAALTGRPRYANHADRILQLIGGRHRPGARRVLPRPGGGRRCAAAASPRSPSSATAPISSPSSTSAGAPRSCWHGVSRYDSPLWEDRTDGLAYVCRDYACAAPQSTPDGLRAQLDS